MDSVIQNAFERTFEKEDQNSHSEEVKKNLPRGADTDYEQEEVEDEFDIDLQKAQIKVVGIGGAGNNTVTTLHDMGIDGAETLALNTDASHLSVSNADKKILIGYNKETS
ncbi:MAG: hypothetical protein ABEJ72_03055, partial [Candidatus Aenigmatarchaeota archaeon]